MLSEEGRKASLLTGGDGRAQQQLMVEVPTTRLHLVTVDADGTARLKLQPRYEAVGDRVLRHDAPPSYDVPPTIDDLFKDASRNYELERTYRTERSATRAKRRDADREHRTQLAQMFLSDPDPTRDRPSSPVAETMLSRHGSWPSDVRDDHR